MLKATKVIEHRNDSAASRTAVLLAAQSAPHHLHVAHRAEHLPRNQHHVRLGRIEPGGENAVIAKYPNVATLEAVEKIAARHGRCAAAHGGSRNAD